MREMVLDVNAVCHCQAENYSDKAIVLFQLRFVQAREFLEPVDAFVFMVHKHVIFLVE